MKIYQYIFIKFYHFEIKIDYGPPEYNAITLLSFCILSIIKSILFLSFTLFLPEIQEFIDDQSFGIPISIIILALSFLLHYLVFIRNKKYLVIERSYNMLPKNKKRIVSISTYVFVIAAIGMPIFIYYLIFTDKL